MTTDAVENIRHARLMADNNLNKNNLRRLVQMAGHEYSSPSDDYAAMIQLKEEREALDAERSNQTDLNYDEERVPPYEVSFYTGETAISFDGMNWESSNITGKFLVEEMWKTQDLTGKSDDEILGLMKERYGSGFVTEVRTPHED